MITTVKESYDVEDQQAGRAMCVHLFYCQNYQAVSWQDGGTWALLKTRVQTLALQSELHLVPSIVKSGLPYLMQLV